MSQPRVGIWFIGAKGGVATTSILGLLALREGRCGEDGLVSALPEFDSLGLARWDQFVIGGHEIRKTRLRDEARQLSRDSRAVDPELVSAVEESLDQIDQRVKPGILFNVGTTIENLATSQIRKRKDSPRECVERVQKDLRTFARRNKLDQVVVINVASTEPPIDATSVPDDWKSLEKLLDKPRKCPLPASSLYAIAALDLGYPYVNFTPSLGSSPLAIRELAELRETCHMGHDGKTGETLLKSTLAPMFAQRNLGVMSWVGHNIFGNMDGKVLDDPVNKATKVTSKDRLLGEILGYHPQTLVSIEYIQSMGDWKTAWDHIHFRGFLGTPMVMQFTWQGCDSLLAAPLVLDLVRLTELAARRGERGLLKFLASFFKSPIGVQEQGFIRQFQMLQEWTKTADDSE